MASTISSTAILGNVFASSSFTSAGVFPCSICVFASSSNLFRWSRGGIPTVCSIAPIPPPIIAPIAELSATPSYHGRPLLRFEITCCAPSWNPSIGADTNAFLSEPVTFSLNTPYRFVIPIRTAFAQNVFVAELLASLSLFPSDLFCSYTEPASDIASRAVEARFPNKYAIAGATFATPEARRAIPRPGIKNTPADPTPDNRLSINFGSGGADFCTATLILSAYLLAPFTPSQSRPDNIEETVSASPIATSVAPRFNVSVYLS